MSDTQLAIRDAFGAPIRTAASLDQNGNTVQSHVIVGGDGTINKLAINPDGSLNVMIKSPGVPEAPTDGLIYGRGSAAWLPVLSIGGGTISGSLTVTGTFTTTDFGTDGADATPHGLLISTLGAPNWLLGTDDTHMAGSDSGNNFRLSAIGDTGVYTPIMEVTRDTKMLLFLRPANFSTDVAIAGGLAVTNGLSLFGMVPPATPVEIIGSLTDGTALQSVIDLLVGYGFATDNTT
jgi:hypothetical protein